MALFESAKALFSGGVYSSFRYFFTPDDFYEAQEDNNRHHMRRIREQREQGIISESEYNRELARMGLTYEADFKNPETSPLKGFKEGAQEGLASMQENTRNAISGG